MSWQTGHASSSALGMRSLFGSVRVNSVTAETSSVKEELSEFSDGIFCLAFTNPCK